MTFIKKFVLASGSLKEVAALYGVSYPTVRLRLDRLIQKIQLTETAEADPICVVWSSAWRWMTSWTLIRRQAPDRRVPPDRREET